MNSDTNSSVTAIIVNWNRKEYVLSLLDALQAEQYRDLALVVVDNASNDGSAAAIGAHGRPLHLVETGVNLGGTGGFNAGLRYALSMLEQDYLWLLDNDALVASDTLITLLAAMHADPRLGVAGSCILSPEDPSLIVEAGAFVDAKSGTWRPNRRYQRHEHLAGRGLVESVDYVPACSALFRTNLLAEIGFLDERFFLHWDDIDFCARARAAGWLVASVLDSRAYHGAEKGHSQMTLYYDFRNALLYFAKNCGGWPLIATCLRILTNYLSSVLYLRLIGQADTANYLAAGLRDFRGGRFGKADTLLLPVTESNRGPVVRRLDLNRKVVVFVVGSYDEVVSALELVKANSPQATVTLVAAADRAEAYRQLHVDSIISYNILKDGLYQRLKTAAVIFGKRFDYGVLAGGGFIVPYAFLVRCNFVQDRAGDTWKNSDVSFSGVWKLPAVLVLGAVLAMVMLLPTWLAARKYRLSTKDVHA